MSNEELYIGREQTLVKHAILGSYLERFAHKVGAVWDTLNYVDCFSGPWNVRSDNLEDSSFAIALSELRRARDTHAQRGRKLRLRCFFLEKVPAAYERLKAFTESSKDVESITRNAVLEESVAEIVRFAKSGGPTSFSFIFIDPTGWTGFEMSTIKPLLQLTPGEVLINFMTGHIRRFIDSPEQETQESFERMFGSSTFRQVIQGLERQQREDAVVQAYTRAAKAAGGFAFSGNAIVLHPERDQTHFNLVYLTRHPEGLNVFKEAERKAMEVQENARAEAQQRKRVVRDKQSELFPGKELHDSTYYTSLRHRYLTKTKASVLGILQAKKRVPYDDAWTMAVSEPLSWESDLKDWITEWRRQGLLEVSGMKSRQRVPHRNEGNLLVWR